MKTLDVLADAEDADLAAMKRRVDVDAWERERAEEQRSGNACDPSEHESGGSEAAPHVPKGLSRLGPSEPLADLGFFGRGRFSS